MRLFKRLRKNKKGAFEAYNWFVLVVSLILFTVAIVSLYVRVSSVPLTTLGYRSTAMLSVQSYKQVKLTEMDEAAKRAAYDALREVAMNGGVNLSLQGYYLGAPIIMVSNNSDPNNRYTFSKIEGYFKEVFIEKMCDEMTNLKLPCSYNKRSVSIINGTIVQGLATQNNNFQIPIIIDGKTYGKAGVTIPYDFTFHFQNYNLDDYQQMYSFVKDQLYDEIKVCSDKSCVRGFLNNINQMPYRFYVKSDDDCFSTYDNYFEDYKVNSTIKSLPREDEIYYLCIFDRQRTIQGINNGFKIDEPAYAVAISTSVVIPSLIIDPLASLLP